MYAIIDIGSNTIRLNVYQVEKAPDAVHQKSSSTENH